jgi:hypothetical protein
MRRLGAKSITALVVADREVAWQILTLNSEKAHLPAKNFTKRSNLSRDQLPLNERIEDSIEATPGST